MSKYIDEYSETNAGQDGDWILLQRGNNYKKILFENIILDATGDVTGPSSSTDNAVVVFDGTTGKIIKSQGSVIIDPSTGDLKLTAGLFMDGDQIISSSGTSVNFGNVGGGITDVLLSAATGQYITMNATETNIGGKTVILVSESIGDNIIVIDTNGNVDFSSTSGTAVRMPRLTTTEQNAVPSVANGMLIYNTSTNKFRGYQNGAWTDVISGGSTYTASNGVTTSTSTNFILDNSYFTGDFTLSAGASTITSIAGKSITLANSFTTSGNFTLTLTQTANTNVTLPTTGTLATLAGAEALTNKTYNGNTWTAGSNTLTLAGNFITTGAFNTTLAAQATVTTTLPPVATTLAGKTGTMSAGYVGVWNDANQLTGSSAITASGGALTITGLMKSAGIETSVRYLAFISGSDTGGAANAIVMFNSGISQGWSTQLKANHDLAFFGYTGGYTEYVRFTRAGGAVNMATSLYVGSISATNSGIVNIKGAGSGAGFAIKTYQNDGTTVSSSITDAGDGYLKSSLTIDTTTFKTVELTLSAAQIKTGYTSPIQIIAAPGSGKKIQIIAASYNFIVGTAFTSTILGISCTSDVYSNYHANVAPGLLNGASSVDEPMYLSSGVGITVMRTNEAMLVWVDSDSATGTGTMKINVTYQIIAS